ncbi:hypothetical protein SAMN05216241_106115 [Limimonas halophila]|uniref:Uncharacterized protein n=1 Tax=Limimonas halophila TaxID=1082479 RepID=A0A1G7S4G1_9PROT|nr:hypothetical protein [Limimonas halophila]SDG17852.1 hypothetical protein SAMN05216241_106115 [Limimonas halophila]
MTGQVETDGRAADAGAPPARAGEDAASVLARLEDDVIQLQGAVEALAVLAHETRESVASALHRGSTRPVETVPAQGLQWAVETLQARVNAMDRRITGHPAGEAGPTR